MLNLSHLKSIKVKFIYSALFIEFDFKLSLVKIITMEDNSPLLFLDADCSRYMYETYYPPETQRIRQGLVMQELMNHIKRYTMDEFYRRYRRDSNCPARLCDQNYPRIVRQFKSGETGWIWSSISASGNKVERGFPIVDNEDGSGYYQFSEETRWIARRFPPEADHYYESRLFMRYLKTQVFNGRLLWSL